LREAGLGSREELLVRWIARGRGTATVRYQAQKAVDARGAVEVP